MPYAAKLPQMDREAMRGISGSGRRGPNMANGAVVWGWPHVAKDKNLIAFSRIIFDTARITLKIVRVKFERRCGGSALILVHMAV